MKAKTALAGLAACLALALAALQAAPLPAQESEDGVLAETKPAEYTGAKDAFGKNLIIVFSVTGNTLKLAKILQQKTGGEIFEIKTETQYPLGDNLIPFAREEAEENRPVKFTSALPDLSEYDTLFFGTPAWFHDVPHPVAAFLQETDFLGKRVIPFVTSGGGPGEAAATLARAIRSARVETALLIPRYATKPPEEIENEVNKWLNPLAAKKPAPDAAGAK
jgi:flavodoxin